MDQSLSFRTEAKISTNDQKILHTGDSEGRRYAVCCMHGVWGTVGIICEKVAFCHLVGCFLSSLVSVSHL